MKLTKFEDIVQHNINNIKEASACVEKFYNLLGMEYSTEIKNISQSWFEINSNNLQALSATLSCKSTNTVRSTINFIPPTWDMSA